MSFEAAFAKTVGLEGRYSNNPSDAGGETCWGITMLVARLYGYAGAMKDMPIATAKAIYRERYWDLMHLDYIDPISADIAAELFDTGVNCGQNVPGTFLQRALNAFSNRGLLYDHVAVDGIIGRATAAALKTYIGARGASGLKVMLYALNAQQGIRYFEIEENNQSQAIFEYGWWLQRVIS